MGFTAQTPLMTFEEKIFFDILIILSTVMQLYASME